MNNRSRFTCRALVIFGLAGFSTTALAENLDIVHLHNGDRISGTVKGLGSGQLELKTEYMDTVYIDWENIRQLISETGQQIELGDGSRLVGTLSKADAPAEGGQDRIVIQTGQEAIEVDTLDMVRMYPVGGGFWDRMDLGIGLGVDYDKSSAVGKYNLSVDAIYREPEFITLANLNSEFTSQSEADNTKRSSLSLQQLKNLPNKRYRGYFGSVEQNDQLGVDFRALLGIGYGWVPISDSRNWFTWGVGLAANLENPKGGAEQDANLEAVGTVRYQYYKRSIPERTLDIYFQVMPSLTQSDRVRADFTIDAKWEFVRDIYWGMEFYSSFDSEPVSPLASDIDYGIRSSIGMKF
jgi:hypothetical protein